MSEIKSCPACGATNSRHSAAEDDVAVQRYCPDCGTTGPVGETFAEADAAWNALPRWPDWRPASEPPEGEKAVLVLGMLHGGYHALVRWFPPAGNEPGAWDHQTVAHWTPLPPGPGEGK